MIGCRIVAIWTAVRNAFLALPVVLISGYAEEERVRLSTAFAFVRKPFTSDSISTAVKNALNRPEASRASTG
ncbi:MAG: hypothetical protein C5B51_01715 [Terriglobia bacterium]|nr:MAG: hypothetical protein C5B51_01715 [Terriglobia bacterium]